MRKILVIALCCLTVAFASCSKENPNERFIGDYSGIITSTVTLSEQLGGDTQVVEDEIVLHIVAGNTENEVIATITNIASEDNENYSDTELKGICEGNNVSFETISITEPVDENFIINAVAEVNGTLSGNVLKINGNVNIKGVNEQLNISLNLAEGTISGNLTKASIK